MQNNTFSLNLKYRLFEASFYFKFLSHCFQLEKLQQHEEHLVPEFKIKFCKIKFSKKYKKSKKTESTIFAFQNWWLFCSSCLFCFYFYLLCVNCRIFPYAFEPHTHTKVNNEISKFIFVKNFFEACLLFFTTFCWDKKISSNCQK